MMAALAYFFVTIMFAILAAYFFTLLMIGVTWIGLGIRWLIDELLLPFSLLWARITARYYRRSHDIR